MSTLLSLLKKFFSKSENIFLWLFFIFLALVFTYPAIFNLSTKLIGDGGDNYQYVSFQYIARENILHSLNPFVHSDIFRYPVGFPFGARFDSIFGTLLGAVISLFSSTVIAYNISIVLSFSLNGFFSYLLFKHLTKSRFIGILGAVIYGFSFYVIARSAGHLNLLSVGGFPLFVLAVLRLSEKFTVKNILIFFLAITFILVSSFQYVFLLFIFVLLTIPILFVFFKHQSIEFVKKLYLQVHKFFLIGILFLLVILPLVFPFLISMANGELNKPLVLEYTPDIRDFFLPNIYLHLWIVDLFGKWNPSAFSIERVVFIGWVELLLFLAFFLSKVSIRIKLFIASVSIVFFILATGLKYDVLSNFFLFSAIPEPGRFFLIFYLFMAIGIALFLKQLYLHNKKVIGVVIILLLSFVIAERLPHNFWLSNTFQNEKFVEVVKQQPGEGVLDIPVSYASNIYNILSSAYGKKIVSGTFLRAADTAQTRSFVNATKLDQFLCVNEQHTYVDTQELLNKLKTNDIYTIVVHKNDFLDYGTHNETKCTNAWMQTSLLLPHLFMPNPTEEERIFLLFYPTVPNLGDTITFQYDGYFYLDGLHAYPQGLLPLHIFLDGQELQNNLVWQDRGEDNATADPRAALEVKKGSKLRFIFEKNHNIEYSFIKIWYRYTAINPSQGEEIINGTSKIFEDDNVAVFHIK